jgi:hypothetical protein
MMQADMNDSTGYFMGAFLGPIMAGTIAAHHGWQSFFWLETALSGVAIILIAITFPETKYHRDHAVRKTSASSSGDVSSGGETEKQMTHGDASESSSLNTAPTMKGRPSRAQFMPFRKPDARWKMFVVRDTWTPIKVFFNPIILWAGKQRPLHTTQLLLTINRSHARRPSRPPPLLQHHRVPHPRRTTLPLPPRPSRLHELRLRYRRPLRSRNRRPLLRLGRSPRNTQEQRHPRS